ncbi:MAG: 1-deoxy-D-xylulose-5-phosphate reductoisomerase [Prolixibacteraceae bacterium]|jgi:1-deoxy-D-xylulose-5-phosphate reductoisomerase|nr:1-deoxy-D-xylulose-5-phosphate reductoisomerase [Prolixibacteraceae bacterium]MBT6765757.1 1-deoxy-D-xylulose-5-phosphate reductoisomerase [Prolixibacteraceae bacterium]MBT6998888.1 1-deoxy-D-xylulose-5-phosphate reductoisomerase [Prolixibacteraceae bacterium]MBT7394668.1 1-deoxy-D-xylulose-5-phosphate reductoisomerase [Prolixibacteraceae bacterium]
MKKRIAILGSTGSIGTQSLEVIDQNPEKFEVEVITANNNVDLLIKQAKKYQPNAVVIANPDKYKYVSDALNNEPIKIYAGKDALNQVVQMETIDLVLTAMVGYSGLIPTYHAVKAGKNIALANKETLVVAGEIITKLAKEKKLDILPVDSEHSAIFQCLVGEFMNTIEKIILTCSGGPFRGRSKNELQDVTVDNALDHPNWEMGAKITIDSATLMNKGFEMIEAHWLFGLPSSKIEVIVHPQSIVHSLVQFEDGSMKAQMGLPDMKLPIQYALGFPYRIKNDFPRFNFIDYPTLEFEPPNTKIFRNLALSFEALNLGGNMPCILNAANEVVVEAFLNKKIGFLQMPEIIEKAMQKVAFIKKPGLEDLIQTNEETRRITQLLSENRN